MFLEQEDIKYYRRAVVPRTLIRPAGTLSGMPSYSDEDLLDEIRRVAEVADADGAPTVTQFDEHSDIADSTVHRRFGSWNQAVATAGFEPNPPETAISNEELTAELHRLRDTLGHLPTIPEMNEHGAYWASTYKNHYDSWTAALVEVFDDVTQENIPKFREQDGTTPPGNPGPRVSDETLLADLRVLRDELDHAPRYGEMRKQGDHRARTYTKRFGSWDEALEAAGIDPPTRNKLTDEELIADLHLLRDELGEKPTSTDVAREGEYGLATYQRRFGSWGEAVAAAFDDEMDE